MKPTGDMYLDTLDWEAITRKVTITVGLLENLLEITQRCKDINEMRHMIKCILNQNKGLLRTND